jgi:molybdopterin-binding protein
VDLIWDGIREAFRIMASGDYSVWEIALRSVLVSGTATAIALLIGITVGAAIAFNEFPGRNLAFSLVNTGMGLPPVVVGLIVAITFWRSGPLGDLRLIYTPAAMVIAQLVIAAPIVTGFTAAALRNLHPRLRAQIYGLGASRFQMLWLVLWEAKLPLLAAVMAGFGGAISEIGASHGGRQPGRRHADNDHGNRAGSQQGPVRGGHCPLPHPSDADLPCERDLDDGAAAGAALLSHPKLSLRDVRVRRGKAELIKVPHLDVPTGEVLVIVGPNGAGKSILLETLALLQRPTQGRVLFEGQPVDGRELALRRRMAVVFQDPLLLRRSVADNVAMGLRLRGVPRSVRRDKAAHWMHRFGIAHLVRRSALTLSGGEAQRANLARAFALAPEVLLLDEPFSALDPPTREDLLDDLAQALRDTGVTTIFVTHDRAEALRLGDRVAVMMGGSIRQVGTAAEVFAAPVDEEVAAFVGVETIVGGRVQSLADDLATIDVSGAAVQAIVPSLDSGGEVLVCLRPEDVVLEPAGLDSHPTSARNHLRGTVRRITTVGGQVRVVLDCGFTLVALITKRSLEEMSLGVGDEVVASFKATAVHVIPRRTA